MPRLIYNRPTIDKGITRRAEFTGEPITPSDSVDLPGGPCNGLLVTGAGNVNVDLASGGTAVLTGLVAGQTVYVDVKRVRATSTTATGLHAMYRAGMNV